MDIKKEVQQILNNHALPTKDGVFIKDNEGQFNKVAEDVVKLFSLHIVSVSFEEGYEKGWREATSEACKEIAKNYQPNER